MVSWIISSVSELRSCAEERRSVASERRKEATQLTSPLMNHFLPIPPLSTFAIESCCSKNDLSSTSLNTHCSPPHAQIALTQSCPS